MPECWIGQACHLWVCRLRQDGCDGVVMPGQAVHLHLGRAQRHIEWCRDTFVDQGQEVGQIPVKVQRRVAAQQGLWKPANLGAHVPHSAHAVPAASHEDVKAGMQRQRVHPAEVAVVLPNDLHSAQQASGNGLPARTHAAGEGAIACVSPCTQV